MIYVLMLFIYFHIVELKRICPATDPGLVLLQNLIHVFLSNIKQRRKGFFLDFLSPFFPFFFSFFLSSFDLLRIIHFIFDSCKH